jgi:hypothetical protein
VAPVLQEIYRRANNNAALAHFKKNNKSKGDDDYVTATLHYFILNFLIDIFKLEFLHNTISNFSQNIRIGAYFICKFNNFMHIK